jgi:hypothetical protein
VRAQLLEKILIGGEGGLANVDTIESCSDEAQWELFYMGSDFLFRIDWLVRIVVENKTLPSW